MRRPNRWEDQPRDPETGRWWRRSESWERRDQELKVRLTEAERQRVEEAARAADQSMTGWLMEAIRLHAGRTVPPQETARKADDIGLERVSRHQRQLAARLHRQHRRH